MKITRGLALVLSGGAYKVKIQIAILALLEFLGIYPESIYAISGGVPNALGYMLQKSRRLPAIWFKVRPEEFYSIDWMNVVVRPLLKFRKPAFTSEAILKSKILEKIIDEEVNFEAVLASPIILWIGVEDLRTGGVKWFSNKDIGMTPGRFRLLVLSSMRIPIFFSPVNDSLSQYVDAGLITNFPVDQTVKDGYKYIIAVNALPRELLKIKKLDSWPEIEARNSDVGHVAEAERHRQAIKRINKDIETLSSILEKEPHPLCGRCEHARENNLFGNFSFSDKRVINFCVVDAPANLRTFRKDAGTYGYPTLEARFELLGAGCEAAVKIVAPYLVKHGIIPEPEESLLNEFQKKFKESVLTGFALAYYKKK